MEAENSTESNDELKAENELLKLKLELEHGMAQSDTTMLGPEVENQWLNNIYNFEQQFKNSKRIKVYDRLERPAYRKFNDLQSEEVSKALEDILSLMHKKGMELDCSCEYEDSVIYRFITEELFEHEIDDMSIPGMISHFIYEEFHPNHDYDLRRYAREFVERLLSGEWNTKFDTYMMSDTITFDGKQYNSDMLSSIILSFQEARTFEINKFEIKDVSFDLEKGRGNVQGHLTYYSNSAQAHAIHEGIAELTFIYESTGYWHINGISLPGLDG